MRLLSASDFAPESFESGAEFLKSLADQPPDCVVLDLNMPGLSGFEIHQRLAQHYPGVGVVMIPVTTGLSVSETHLRSVRLLSC